jgi:mRNA-degrading endonuclease RelE of RelBE toxin-antitoxin system
MEKEGARARIGGYRILFDIENDKIDILKISPRGDAYKENWP